MALETRIPDKQGSIREFLFSKTFLPSYFKVMHSIVLIVHRRKKLYIVLKGIKIITTMESLFSVD
jgi:hypothetical protein